MTPSTVKLPELPEPAELAYVEGVAMQGGEYRSLAMDYDEWSARYSVRQMTAYGMACRLQAINEAADAAENLTRHGRMIRGAVNSAPMKPCDIAAAIRALGERKGT